MGTVYLAEHTLLGRQAAIKVLLPELSTRAELVTRFFNEARAASTVQHPGIVEIFDFGHHSDGSAFIVMEFLQGESLAARLRRVRSLSESLAASYVRQMCSGLAAAHAKGIIHRDIKPDNVFLVPDPIAIHGERIKILDFGIAKLATEQVAGSMLTRTGMVLGTPMYMSPEQCRGLGKIDSRSDLYSLGCLLYAMVCGRPPFVSEGMGDIMAKHIYEPVTPPSTLVAISPGFEQVVMRALAKNPSARYSSADELAAALERACPTGTYAAPPPGAPSRFLTLPTPVTPPHSFPPSATPTTPAPATPKRLPTPSTPTEWPTATTNPSAPSATAPPERNPRALRVRWPLFAGVAVASAVVIYLVLPSGGPAAKTPAAKTPAAKTPAAKTPAATTAAPSSAANRAGEPSAPAIPAATSAKGEADPSAGAAGEPGHANPAANPVANPADPPANAAGEPGAAATPAATTPPAGPASASAAAEPAANSPAVTLRITSKPRGDVFRMPGHVKVGTTPFTLSHPIGGGAVTFQIERAGHRSQTVTFRGDQDGKRRVRLHRAAPPRREPPRLPRRSKTAPPGPGTTLDPFNRER